MWDAWPCQLSHWCRLPSTALAVRWCRHVSPSSGNDGPPKWERARECGGYIPVTVLAQSNVLRVDHNGKAAGGVTLCGAICRQDGAQHGHRAMRCCVGSARGCGGVLRGDLAAGRATRRDTARQGQSGYPLMPSHGGVSRTRQGSGYCVTPPWSPEPETRNPDGLLLTFSAHCGNLWP